MKVFEYRVSSLQKTSRIFSDKIRNDPWVLFHGTAACWEKEIDAAGLKTSHFPVSLGELREIMKTFKSMNLRTDHLGSLLAWSFPEEVNGKEFREIFLASIPELAACYCDQSTAGGESTEMARGCLRDLRKWLRDKSARIEHLRRQLVDYEEARKWEEKARFMKISWSWLRREISRFVHLESRLRKLAGAGHCGVVYAFRFKRMDIPWLSGSNDTYKAYRDIPPDRIIAKARILGRGRCDHLERSQAKFHRDFLDPNTLMGAIHVQDRHRSNSRPAVVEFDREWTRAPVDPTAGVDLAERFDRDGLLLYLRQRHPELFTDVDLCEQYGW